MMEKSFVSLENEIVIEFFDKGECNYSRLPMSHEGYEGITSRRKKRLPLFVTFGPLWQRMEGHDLYSYERINEERGRLNTGDRLKFR